RCASSVTVLQPQTPEGVTFPSTVTAATSLDGFRVDRFNAQTTAGITVSGAKGVQISGVSITNTPAVMVSYGVNVIQGGDVTLTGNCHIDSGNGMVESTAVHVNAARITVTRNCATIDATGHCTAGCGNNPSIRGRLVLGPGETYAVRLIDSPGS